MAWSLPVIQSLPAWQRVVSPLGRCQMTRLRRLVAALAEAVLGLYMAVMSAMHWMRTRVPCGAGLVAWSLPVIRCLILWQHVVSPLGGCQMTWLRRQDIPVADLLICMMVTSATHRQQRRGRATRQDNSIENVSCGSCA